MGISNMNRILSIGLLVLAWAIPAQAALPIQHWQTDSGADVYFVENHDLPILDVSVNFAAGSAHDTPEKSGLANVTRHLMTLGADGMNETQISEKLADVGASLGGEFDSDRASLSVRTLSSAREQGQALAVLAALLQQPTFPEAILEREKARVVSALQEAATKPAGIADKAFQKALFRDHPYALRESGEPETVAGLQRQDLVDFYQRHYRAQGAVIALIGDVSREQAAQIAESLTAGLPQGDAASAKLPDVAYPQQAVTEKIPHPASQSHILLGYPGMNRGDPDYFPLYVGNYILGGGGFVSRLTEEVREKRGLVYSVYSYFMPMSALGPFQIGLQTKTEQADEALKVVRSTLSEFVRKGPTAQELKAARQNIVGGFPLRIDSNQKILQYLAVIGFYKLPLTYLDDFNKQIEKVTVAQIKDAFSRRIDPDKMVTVIVGGE